MSINDQKSETINDLKPDPNIDHNHESIATTNPNHKPESRESKPEGQSQLPDSHKSPSIPPAESDEGEEECVGEEEHNS